MGKLSEQTPHQLRYTEMVNQNIKTYLMSYVIRQLKIKQLDTTMYQLEWLKSKTLTPPNASKDLEQQEFSFIANGNENCYSLAIFQKPKTYSYYMF